MREKREQEESASVANSRQASTRSSSDDFFKLARLLHKSIQASYQQIDMHQIRYKTRPPKACESNSLEKRPPLKRKVIRRARPRPPELATLAAALDAKVADLRSVTDEVDSCDQVSTFRSPFFFVVLDKLVEVECTAFARVEVHVGYGERDEFAAALQNAFQIPLSVLQINSGQTLSPARTLARLTRTGMKSSRETERRR